MHKRIFSLMLVICLLLNVLPVGGRAFAAGSDDAIQYTASDRDKGTVLLSWQNVK